MARYDDAAGGDPLRSLGEPEPLPEALSVSVRGQGPYRTPGSIEVEERSRGYHYLQLVGVLRRLLV